jgi:predicted DNA-binding ArsR family transcriptional regulator
MQVDHPNRRRRCADSDVQRAVMALTLAVYPQWRTTRELRREIGCGGVVKRAVRDLIAIGLLERRTISIRPTEAAAHLERLQLP